MNLSILKRLALKGTTRDWDKAVIFADRIEPISIREDVTVDYNTTEEKNNWLVTLKSEDSADPFFDPRVDGSQPRLCTHEVHMHSKSIRYVHFVKYPKILTNSSKLIVPGQV